MRRRLCGAQLDSAGDCETLDVRDEDAMNFEFR